MPSKDLVYRFFGVDSGAGAEFDRMAEKTAATGRVWTKYAIGAAAAAGTVGAASIKMAVDFEAARSRLDSAAANVGGSIGALNPKFEGLDSSLAKLGFTSTDTESSLAGLVTATKSPTVAMQQMALAADLARGRNISLAQATDILVKVDTGHVALLGRIGINTKTVTGATISQEQAIRRLTQLYGGDASRYAQTFAGRLDVIKADAEDLGVKIGTTLIPPLEHGVTLLADVAHVGSSTVGMFRHNEAAAAALAGVLTYTLVPSLIKVADSALDTLTLKLMYAGDGIKGFMTGVGSMGAAGLAGTGGLSLLASGLAAAVVYEKQLGAAAQQAAKQLDSEFNPKNVTTMQQLNAQIRQVEQGYTGLLDKARSHDSSLLGMLTSAFGTDQYDKIYGAELKQVGAIKATQTALGQLSTEYGVSRNHVLAFANAAGITLTGNLSDDEKALRGAASAALGIKNPSAEAVKGFLAVEGAANGATNAVNAASDAFDRYVGNFLGLKQSQLDFINDLDSLRGALHKSNGEIGTGSKAQRDARAQFIATATQIDNVIQQLQNMPQPTQRAVGALEEMRKKLAATGATGPLVTRTLDGITKAIDSLKGKAFSSGEGLGKALGHGVVAGIRVTDTDIQGVSHAVIENSLRAMRWTAQVQSPSKQTAYIGRMLAQGLIGGWSGEAGRIRSLLSTDVQNALSKLTEQTKAEISKQQQIVKAARSNLNSLLSSEKSDIGSLAGTIAGTDLGSLFSTDANGNPTTGNLGAYLASQSAATAKFTKDLQALSAKHLAPGLVNAIASLGSSQGDTLAQQVLSGQAGTIASLTASWKSINATAKIGAGSVVSPLYAHRIEHRDAQLTKAIDRLDKIEKAIREEKRHAGQAVAQHITIEVKGDKLKLTRMDGAEIVKALNELNRTTGQRLDHKTGRH